MSVSPENSLLTREEEELAEFMFDMDLLSASVGGLFVARSQLPTREDDNEHMAGNSLVETPPANGEPINGGSLDGGALMPALIRFPRPPQHPSSQSRSSQSAVSGLSGLFSSGSPPSSGKSVSSCLTDDRLYPAELDTCRSYSSSMCLGRGPLHMALAKGASVVEVKRLLVDPGATRVRDSDGMTPLHLAMKRKTPCGEAVLEVLNYDPDAASLQDDWGKTPRKL